MNRTERLRLFRRRLRIQSLEDRRLLTCVDGNITSIDLPTSISEELALSSEIDRYVFNATENEAFRISVGAGTLETFQLDLHQVGSEDRIASDQATTLDPSAEIRWRAPNDGQFCIVLQSEPDSPSGPTGSYELNVEPLADDHPNTPQEATEITIPSTNTVNGEIEYGTDQDYFSFNTTAGQLYRITIPDSDMRVIGHLFDATALENDDFGNELHSISTDRDLIWRAPDDGTYYIKVERSHGWSESSRSYSLELSAISDDHADVFSAATPAATSGTTNGRVDSPTDDDYFSFEAAEGTTYSFELRSQFDNGQITLYDTDGTTVLDPTLVESRGPMNWWTAPADGIYYLAHQADRATGDYALDIATVPYDTTFDDITTIAIPSRNTVEDRTASTFQFDATEGTTYTVSTAPRTSESGEPQVEIVSGGGSNSQFGIRTPTLVSSDAIAAEALLAGAVTFEFTVTTFSDILLVDAEIDQSAGMNVKGGWYNETAIGLGTDVNPPNESVAGVFPQLRADTWATTPSPQTQSAGYRFDGEPGMRVVTHSDTTDDGAQTDFTFARITLIPDDEGRARAVFRGYVQTRAFPTPVFDNFNYIISIGDASIEDSDGGLVLLNEQGTEIQASGEHIVWTAPANGTYTLKPTDGAEPFAFEIQTLVADDDHGDTSEAATAVSSQGLTTGQINFAGDTDLFSFPANEGQTYSLSADSQNVSLIGSDGVTQIEPATYASIGDTILWTAPADGTYFIEVTDRNDDSDPVGGYTLQIDQPIDDHADLARSSTAIDATLTATGQLESPGDIDFFSFEATAGTIYELSTQNDFEEGHVTLYTRGGFNPITTVVSGEVTSWSPEVDGRYFLSFTNTADFEPGSYTLSVEVPQDDHSGFFGNATPISGDPLTAEGRLDSQIDVDYFSFEASVENVYLLDLQSPLENGSLTLHSGNGTTPLATIDRDSTTWWSPPQDGTYYLSYRNAGEFESGEYSVTIETVADDHGNFYTSATPLQAPTTVEGVGEAPNDIDFFSFDATRGEVFSFEVESDVGLLRLYDTNGTRQLSAIRNGSATRFWVAPDSGTYFLAHVYDAATVGSSFSFDVLTHPDDHGNSSQSSTAIEVDTSVTAQLETPFDIDFFSFEAAAGAVYSFAHQQDVGSGTLTLFDTDGDNQLTTITIDPTDTTDAEQWWIAPGDGIYHLAYEASGVTGPYTVSVSGHGVEPSPNGGEVISVPSIETITNPAEDPNTFLFQAVQDVTYSFAAVNGPNNGEPHVSVVSDGGNNATFDVASVYPVGPASFFLDPEILEGAVTFDLLVSTETDIILVDAEFVGTPGMNVPGGWYNLTDPFGLGSDTSPPNPAILPVFLEVAYDTWVTTPGNTSAAGTHTLNGPPEMRRVTHLDSTDDGDQTDFTFARITLLPDAQGNASLTFRGTMQTAADPTPIFDDFEYVLSINSTAEPSTGNLTLLDVGGAEIASGSNFEWTPSESDAYVLKADDASDGFTFEVKAVDDHGDSFLSATPIVPDTTVEGFVSAQNDSDFFSFEAQEGDTFSFELQGNSGSLRLLDNNGFSVLQQFSANSDPRFWVAPETGTYFFAHDSNGPSDVGNTYSIDVLIHPDDHGDNWQSATVIDVSAAETTITGEAETSLDVDYFAFEVSRGEVFTFEGQSESGTIRLYGPNGLSPIRSIREDTGNDLWVAPTAGTYFIGHRAFLGGSYSVNVQRVPDDHGNDTQSATRVEFETNSETTITGESETELDIDFFSFEAKGGSVYSFAVQQDTGQFTLFDTNGNLPLTTYRIDPADPDQWWIAPTDGVYYLGYSPHSSAGTYAIDVSQFPAVPESTGGETIFVPSINTIRNPTEDPNTFLFSANEGVTYSFMPVAQSDEVTLLESGGNNATFGVAAVTPVPDDLLDSDRNLIEGAVTFDLLVSTGSDILLVDAEIVDSDGMNVPGGWYNENATGTDINPPNPAFIPIFPQLAFDTWVTTPGATANAGVYTLDGPSGMRLVTHSDTTDDGPQSDFHFARVTLLPDADGNASLIFRGTIQTAANPVPIFDDFEYILRIGGTTEPSIDEFGDFSLFNVSGTELDSGTNLEWTAPATGPYVLRADVTSDSFAFEVQVVDDHGNNPQSATPISTESDSTIEGINDSAEDFDYFSFEATAGSVYTFEPHYTNGDGELTLLDTDGINQLTTLRDEANQQLRWWIAPTDGVYYLTHQATGQFASYTIDVSRSGTHLNTEDATTISVPSEQVTRSDASPNPNAFLFTASEGATYSFDVVSPPAPTETSVTVVADGGNNAFFGPSAAAPIDPSVFDRDPNLFGFDPALPKDAVTFSLNVTTDSDIILIDAEFADTPGMNVPGGWYNHPLQADINPPNGFFGIVSGHRFFDTWVTTPGATAATGNNTLEGPPGMRQVVHWDSTDEGPQTDFRFAQITLIPDEDGNASLTFRGTMQTAADPTPIFDDFEYVLSIGGSSEPSIGNLGLFDAAGSRLESGDDFQWTAPETGAFVVRTEDVASDEFAFQINIVDDHGDDYQNATIIDSTRTAEGYLHSDDVDFFSFEATAGAVYAIESSVENGDLRLYNTNGIRRLNTVQNDANDQLHWWIAPADGVYYLAQSSNSPTTYTIDITQTALLEDIGNVTAISDSFDSSNASPLQITGTATPDNQTTFVFNAVAGETYSFEAIENAVSPSVGVITNGGNNATFDGAFAEVDVEGVPDGAVVFSLAVSTDSDILLIDAEFDDTPGANAPGGWYNDEQVGSDTQPPNPAFLPVFPTASVDSWVTTPGATAAAGANTLDGEGDLGVITHSDSTDEGPQTDFTFAQITLIPDENGNATLVFRGTLQTSADQRPILDEFEFVLTLGAEDSESIGNLGLFNASGERIETGSDFEWTATETGTYIIRTEDVVSDQFTFEIQTVQDQPSNPTDDPADDHGDDFDSATTIHSNNTVIGTLDDGDTDVFSFQAQGGTTYRLAIGAEVGIFDADGTLIAEDSSGLIDWTAPHDGTFFIRATAAPPPIGGASGTNEDYALNLRVYGDLDSDGVVDSADLGTLLRSMNLTGADWQAGDLTGDGQVDIADHDLLIANFGHVHLPCDYVGNSNGCDAADLDALFAGTHGAPELTEDALDGWYESASHSANVAKDEDSDVYRRGDTNLDGTVASIDLGVVLNNFGQVGLGWRDGNLNSDDVIDSTDLGLLMNAFVQPFDTLAEREAARNGEEED